MEVIDHQDYLNIEEENKMIGNDWDNVLTPIYNGDYFEPLLKHSINSFNKMGILSFFLVIKATSV